MEGMELYLIRHGQSLNNAMNETLRQRVCDPPLTELGGQQARLAAERLRSLDWARPPSWDSEDGSRLTRLYTSPMLRALETAEAIRQATELTPHVWTDLHEHGGIWLDYNDGRGQVGLPGMGRSEMQERFPHFVLPEGLPEDGWWNRPFEDEASAYGRAQRVAHGLRQWANTEERMGLVGHGGLGDSLIGALLDMPFVGHLRFNQYNTALSRLDVTPQGVKLRFLNRVDHLPAELIT
jgi:broad specificity phosphatase PhoE